MLGYGYKHTEVAWAASKIKQNQIGFSGARNSYLGDSFSIYSFVMFAVACSKKFLPVLTYKQLALRMGLAPGFRASLRTVAPLGKSLLYGTPSKVLIQLDGDPEQLNRLLLRRTNHTGSDVRVTSGEVMNSKVSPGSRFKQNGGIGNPYFHKDGNEKPTSMSLSWKRCCSV